MARSQFGGRSEQVGVQVQADQSLKLAPNAVVPDLYDKQVWDVTRVVVTGFLLDANGAEGAATSTLTTDNQGIPPYFWGPDGLSILYDEEGHALYANRGTEGSVVAASETVAGIIEIADDTESAAGLDNLKAMTPEKVAARIAAHNGDGSAHNDIRTVVNETAVSSRRLHGRRRSDRQTARVHGRGP